MEITWNFQKILKEIEQIKSWKTKTFEEEASKYYALKRYYDLLWHRTANDKDLEERSLIFESTNSIDKYLAKKHRLEKKLTKIFNEQEQEMLLDFMKVTQNNSLKNTRTNLEAPLIRKYNYQLPNEAIIKMSDEFFNSIFFMDKNIASKMLDQDLICFSEACPTVYSSQLGKFYPTGHILCTYKESVDLSLLIILLHEIGHSKNLSFINGYFAKELHIGNIFGEFFSRLMELLSLDYFRENYDFLAPELNLYKYTLLNNQNNYLRMILSKLEKHPNITMHEIMTGPPKFLLENFGKNSVPELGPTENHYNEKKYYEIIIRYMEEELLTSKNSTALSEFKEKLKNPLTFIFPELIFGNNIPPSVHFADNIILDGKYLISTLLAMKFYYLIRADKEKGMALLKEVSEELIFNYKNTGIVLQKYGLEDFILPDYIQQYATDYNSEKTVIKK